MANHPWPFTFPGKADVRDINVQDWYELIIHAVAVGNQESNRASRIGTGTANSADAVAAALRVGRADILQG